MQQKTSSSSFAVLLLLCISMAACEPGSPPTIAPVEDSTPIEAATLPPTHTPTMEVQASETAPTVEPTTAPTSQDPTSTPASPEPTIEPPAEPESCLVGSWSVIHESLVGYLVEAFDQSGLITFEFETGEGDLFLTFDRQGVTNYVAEDLELRVAIPGVASFSFIVQGDGVAQYAAENGIIATWGHVSALTSEGAGQVGDEQTDAAGTVVLTPEQIFIDSTGDQATFTWVDVPEDARFTHFTCEGDLLSLNLEGTLGSQWQRVIGK